MARNMSRQLLHKVCQLAILVIAFVEVMHSLPADLSDSTGRPSSPSDNPETTDHSRFPSGQQQKQPETAGVPSQTSDAIPPRQGSRPSSQDQESGDQKDSGSQLPGRPGPPPSFGPPPCLVVHVANGTELMSHPCPADSNCTEPPPHGNSNPNREVDIFFCTPPRGLRFGPPSGSLPGPIQCRVVDKKTNESRVNVECPRGTSCQILDRRNPDDTVDIYLCTPPFQGGRGQAEIIDGRPRPCKVVQKATGATLESRECPDGKSCTDLDQRNPDRNVDIFNCAISSSSSSQSQSS